jgi:hypothetical protein
MNRITRNLVVVLLVAVSSLIVAAALIFVELRSGRQLYGYTLWTYVPAGAIGAGLVAAAGFYLAFRVLRVRPSKLALIAVVVFAAGTVFLVDSVDFGLSTTDRRSIADAAAFTQFLGNSLANSPLKIAFAGASDSGSSSGSGTVSDQVMGAVPQVASDNDASVQTISGGVQNALASNKVNPANAFSGVQQRVAGMQAFGSGVASHGAMLEFAALQFAGFVLGGLFAFSQLRSISYCDSCEAFLSKKGLQTRYFDTMRDIQGSIDDFLTKVKGRQYRQSIQVHAEEGSAAKTKSSAFASSVEIRQCKGCQRHRLQFSARRKEGRGWKDISMLGYTTFCLEPIDVARG